MSPKTIALQIVNRHSEFKELDSKQLKAVKRAIEEAIAISMREVLSHEETDREFRRLVLPDSGEPSAALRAYRKRSELTQRELAEKSNVPQPHIAAMESGKRPIGLITAKKLALALGVNHRKLI